MFISNSWSVLLVGGPIVDVIDRYANAIDKQQLRVDRTKKDYPHPVITYQTKGQCTFKFGVEQRIDLEEETIQ